MTIFRHHAADNKKPYFGHIPNRSGRSYNDFVCNRKSFADDRKSPGHDRKSSAIDRKNFI